MAPIGVPIIRCGNVLVPFNGRPDCCPMTNRNSETIQFIDGEIPEGGEFCWQNCAVRSVDCPYKPSNPLEWPVRDYIHLEDEG